MFKHFKVTNVKFKKSLFGLGIFDLEVFELQISDRVTFVLGLFDLEIFGIFSLHFHVPLPRQALYRVAVDGGIKDLYELDRGSPSIFIPHTVCGDFDSVDMDTLDEYKKSGVEIIELADQNKTGH